MRCSESRQNHVGITSAARLAHSRLKRVGGMETTHAPLVTALALSRRLGISAVWLRNEARAGRIPSLLAGRRRLVNLTAVEASLAHRAALSTGGSADER